MSPPYGPTAGALGPWAARLQTASWRGVPFAVQTSTIQRGRRTVTHEYPYKPVVWVEDLGLGVRGISFTGFLTGDDVYDQRDRMIAAAETVGPGILVHPSLGSVTANLIEFSATEQAEAGRRVGLDFRFIQGGQAQPAYPSTTTDTAAALGTAADASDSAVESDYVIDTAQALLVGADVVAAGLAVVSTAVGLVITAAADASLIAAAVAGLPGNNGRYASGGRTTAQPASATDTSALSGLITARTAVKTAGSAVQAAAATAPTAGLPAAMAALLASLAAAAQDPTDQIRLFSGLAAFTVTPLPSAAPIGTSISTVQTATAAMFRRLALSALARAIALYQPSSYNDAITILDAITALLDAEIVIAADAGDTASYLGLRGLRVAAVTDLTTRGAQLPELVTVTLPQSLPALVIAYRLYQDATRADDLIARVNPVHPAFMPTSFDALSF